MLDARYISMFSGIEAASVAWEPLGWIPICFSEIEPFPSAVLSHRFPDVPNVGDMTRHDWSHYRGQCDLVVGGPPCQAFSVAGLRRSLADDRGNLSLQFVKAIHAIGPVWAVTENVPGWLSTPDNAFGCFLGALVGGNDALHSPLDGGRWPSSGMAAGPWARVAWRVLDAQHFGLAQRRRRVFVVAGFGDGADPAAVLFEPKGVRGNYPARGEAREEIAPTISARTRGGGGLGTDFDLDGGLTLTRCVTAGYGQRLDYETETFVAHALRGDGFDASEDGTGRGTPIMPVAFTCKDHGADAGELAPTLRAMGHDGSHANAGGQVAVAFEPRFARNDRGGPSDLVNALKAEAGRTGKGDAAPCVASETMVRRLTPRECERLQGFPDDHTLIPWRGRPAAQCPDGPRYKSIGNSKAVPVVRWIGARIAEQNLTRA